MRPREEQVEVEGGRYGRIEGRRHDQAEERAMHGGFARERAG